jgi:hypothetical protein
METRTQDDVDVQAIRAVSYTRYYEALNFSICDERHSFPIELKLMTIFQKSCRIMVLGLSGKFGLRKGDPLRKSSPLLPDIYIYIYIYIYINTGNC